MYFPSDGNAPMFEIPEGIEASPRRLTQAVLQAADLLGLYNAELARVLGLMCGDIGRIASARDTLTPGTDACQKALLFLRIYRALYVEKKGNEAAMYNWLRIRQAQLGEAPLIVMVDHGGLGEVVNCIERNTEGTSD